MANNDFFETKLEEKPVVSEEAVEEPEKIKLGEKEYSQDELSKLVGLGETANELETKWNTKIDRLYPEYTKATQDRKELEDKIKEFETKQVETKVQSGAELTEEEVKQNARAEAKKLGLISVDDVNDYIYRALAARDLNEDIEAVIETNKVAGKPETNFEDLIGYMQTSGVRNPQDAYDLMFKNEVKEWERKQIDSIKKPGMVTEDTSTAGAKQPPQRVAITKENIQNQLDEVLFRET